MPLAEYRRGVESIMSSGTGEPGEGTVAGLGDATEEGKER
jgi:hypothetical protein